MKQLVILSGKGGTGKTSITAAFAQLAYKGPKPLSVVLADADVDAANLELVLQPRRIEEHNFFSGAVAVIDEDRCEECGICEHICRFEAILPLGSENRSSYNVNPITCDGCAACVYQCPEHAIRMETQLAGYWFRSESRFGSLLHAELLPAQENSGKLVTMVKQQARLLAIDAGSELVLVDGPPGIGCPVISAAAGADLALIVTEPTAAAIHDMQRVLQLTQHFRLPALTCINKADIYPEGTYQIRNFCNQNNIKVVGSIPFDDSVTLAMLNGEPVTAYKPNAPASLNLVDLWQQLTIDLMSLP